MDPKKSDDERFCMRIPVHNDPHYEINWDAPTPALLLWGGYGFLGQKGARLYSAMLQAHSRGETFPAPQKLRERYPGLRRHFEKLKMVKLIRTVRGMGNRTIAIELAYPERLPMHDMRRRAWRRVELRMAFEKSQRQLKQEGFDESVLPTGRLPGAQKEEEDRTVLPALREALRNRWPRRSEGAGTDERDVPNAQDSEA